MKIKKEESYTLILSKDELFGVTCAIEKSLETPFTWRYLVEPILNELCKSQFKKSYEELKASTK